MSNVRYKVVIEMELDTDDFPVPADGRLSLSVRDEIKDIIETNMAVTVNHVKLTRIGAQNDDEVWNND